jgi:CXXX repeat peptide maturase
MLEHLIILLDNTSIAYCYADNPSTESYLMPIDILKKAIVFGMKENLMINYVLPKQPLSKEYSDLLETIDNNKIGESIRVANNISEIGNNGVVILRITYQTFISNIKQIGDSLSCVDRLNICFINIEDFNDLDIPKYKESLSYLVSKIYELQKRGLNPSINLITDRIGKTSMTNCGAGVSNITIAPNGRFYICPAFYYDEQLNIDNLMNHSEPESKRSVGDLENGLNIPNRDLLHLDYAPLCRICDAYHCHRCVWLNQKLTGDINTPSRQQCVMAHIERNAARELNVLAAERDTKTNIPEINYIDPFDLFIRK